MINTIEKMLEHKRGAGITTYSLNTAEVETLVRIARVAEMYLTAPNESLRLILIGELREIGALE